MASQCSHCTFLNSRRWALLGAAGCTYETSLHFRKEKAVMGASLASLHTLGEEPTTGEAGRSAGSHAGTTTSTIQPEVTRRRRRHGGVTAQRRHCDSLALARCCRRSLPAGTGQTLTGPLPVLATGTGRPNSSLSSVARATSELRVEPVVLQLLLHGCPS